MPMIKCPDCQHEMSDSAPSCPNCGRPNEKVAKRSVGFLLGVGIFLFPIIFSWFTLRKGHSATARIVAFAWLVIPFVIIGFQANSNQQSTMSVASTSSTSNEASVDKAVSNSPTEEVMQVGIQNLLSAYEDNEIGADNRYKDKLVQVTGIVDSVKKDILDNLYVTLGTGRQFQIPTVQAFFDDSMNEQLGQLSKGQQLTVVCRIDGLMMNVLAKECIIK